MNKQKVVWFCIILFLFTKNAICLEKEITDEKGRVSGNVIDSNSMASIEYAGIAIFKKSDSSLIGGIITDSKGRFELKQIPDGKYYLMVQFMGFAPKRLENIEINKQKRNIQLGSIYLAPMANQLKTVNITSEKRLIEYKLDKKIINANAQITTSGGTAIDILKNSPSVTVDNEDNVSMRGKSDFQVFINGHPSVLKGTDALKQIPAANIENIEIITNPSANQDAEGSAGIINIITKKNTLQGTGAMVSITGGTDRYNADISISHQINKWNFTLGAKYIYANILVDNTNQHSNFLKDSTLYIDEVFRQYHTTKISGINWNIDYDADKNNTFSLALNYGTWRHLHDFDIKYIYSNSINPTKQYSLSENDYQIGYQYASGNIFYKHIFGKNHDLSTNLFYSVTDGDRRLDAIQYLSNYQQEKLLTNKMSKNDETNLSGDLRYKIDYTRPVFKNLQLETGVQVQIKPYDANTKYDNFNITNNQWIPDTLYTNNILFDVNLYAAYLTLSGNLNKIEYKIGLRSEYYERNFSYKNSNISYPYNQIDIFPTLHLSYKQSEKNQYQLSISRRVNRPGSWFMYPVPSFSDSYNVVNGNPDLKPEFVNAFEFNYIHNFEKALFSLGISHSRSNGTFTQLLLDDKKGVIHQKTVNFGNEYFTGFESALNTDLYKWLSINLSTSLYYAIIKANTEDINSSIKTNIFNTRLNTTLIPYKNIKLQIALYYDAPFDYVQSHISERFNGTVSIRKDFTKQKLSITFTARNPIWGSTNYTDITDNYFMLKSTDKMKAAYSITLSLRLNNYKRQRNVGEQMNVGEGV
jgi:hypothetical protein